jgi:DNA-binding GntR family transcriptional regulator
MTHASELPLGSRGAPRESLADHVYRTLLDGITSGTLDPGQHLREVQLAQQFRVSTTPIREALRRLEREGLVHVSPHRGAIVAEFDATAVANLYEVRQLLECHAIRQAAAVVDRDFTRIDELLADMARVIDAPDQLRFNQLDLALHRELDDLAGNPQLSELAARVHRQIQGVRARCAVHLPGRPSTSHAQHQAIVAAVRTREAAAADALLQQHIESVRSVVVRVLARGAGAGY